VLRIGTSGWIYKHWRGLFYPPGLPQRRWLEFYARHFDTVEVNFSFYRLPARETFEAWRERAAPGFCYAVKGSRFVTHLKRLRDPREHVDLFLSRVAGLDDRTGPILWQLPPDFRRDDARLRGFLEALAREYHNAVEFRHESWMAEPVLEMPAEHGVALRIPDHPRFPRPLRLTAGWTYIHFHYGGAGNGNYGGDELAAWAERIRGFQQQGAAVWAYFNNDWAGLAIKNALALRERLTPAR
jgi:uncharacterized protein YecE (DUF72 family)